METKIKLRDYPITAEALGRINKNYFLFLETYEYILNNFGAEYFSFSEEVLTVLKKKCKTEGKFADAVTAFVQYSHEYLILQAKLVQEGKYQHSSFEEVNQKVYQHYLMNKYYLDGLLLSHLFWPNHYKIVRYFLSRHDRAKSSSVILDAPCGSGMFSYLAARHFSYRRLCAVDISPYASAYTAELLNSAALDTKKISVETQDIFALKTKQRYDVIICAELLEHVEDPAALLNKLKTLLADHGIVFLTTAVYAAAIDHIYLFNDVSEARELIKRCFYIDSELVLPLSRREYNPEMKKTAINYACVLKK